MNDSKIKLLGLFNDDHQVPDLELESAQFLALFKAAVVLSQRHNTTVNGQLIGWHVEQTDDNVIDTLRKTCRAVSTSNVVGIVGPRLSREAHTIAAFADTLGIPVVSYAATDPDLSSRSTYRAFYRTVPSDTAAVLSVVQLFKRFNWTSCMIIYQNDVYGYRGMRAISDELVKNNIKVTETIKFDSVTHAIEYDLKHNLLNSPTRIVILWAVPNSARIILQQALSQDIVGPHFLWILSSRPSLDSFDLESGRKLMGMLSVESVTGGVVNATINATLRMMAYAIWQEYEPQSFPGENKVSQHALFTFDATWLLIQSLRRFCVQTSQTATQPCVSFINASVCFDHRLINASSFFETITATSFLGVSGPIEFNANKTDRTKGIHLITQNVRSSPHGLSFVPVLKYSESNIWQTYHESSDTIIWPDGSCLIPSGLAVLSGIPLRIGMIESPPFTIIERVNDSSGRETIKFDGYMPDLVDLLREKMHFIANMTLVPKSNYANYIQSVANGHYDMLIGDLTVTAERREIVSFSTSIFDDSYSIVIRKPTSINVDFFSYLNPFSDRLWVIILATILYASVLMILLERRRNATLRDRSVVSVAGMSIWYCIGTIMGYGADFQATTVSGRVLTVALYMISLILVATYTANLASNLSSARPKFIINGIDDIKDGKLPFHRVGILKSTAIEEFYLREVPQDRKKFYPLKNRADLLASLFNGKIDATLLGSAVAEYLTNEVYCNITMVGGYMNDVMFGIAMKKNWPYAQELDTKILFLRESGHLDKLRRKWFQTRGCQKTTEISIAIQVESMAGLFLTCGMITAVAISSFIWSERVTIKNYLLLMKSRIHPVAKENNASTRHRQQTD